MPLRVVACGPSESGPRLGGTAPEGVRPSVKTRDTRYLATIPLSDDGEIDVSFFLSLTFDEMLRDAGRMYQGAAIEPVTHSPRGRGRGDEFKSVLSPHPLDLGGARDDWSIEDGGEIIESGHKIGGRAYLIQSTEARRRELERAWSEGFRQFLQLDTPAEAAVKGDWPFANGMFHAFVRVEDSDRPLRWRFFWESG